METRICNTCEQEKSLDTDFFWKNKKKGTKRYMCIECVRAYNREHYKNNKKAYINRALKRNKEDRIKYREFIWKYLSENPCVDCGENDPLVLEFDHRDSESKKFVISRPPTKSNLSVIREEIAKCDVRCANCHRRRTAKQQDWYKKFRSMV